MAILISGDFHNNACGEMRYITKENLIDKYGELYNEINYHIILGDAGFLWPEYGEYKNKDKENFEMLKERNFPILCVMGNHEPVYGRKDLSMGVSGRNEKEDEEYYDKNNKKYTIIHIRGKFDI